MTTRLVNLTPHTINLHLATGEMVSLPPDGTVARCTALPREAPVEVAGLPVPILDSPAFSGVTGLPPATPGVAYIVAGMVLAHPDVRGRADVFGPGTGPDDGAVRNEKGQVAGVTRLVRAPR